MAVKGSIFLGYDTVSLVIGFQHFMETTRILDHTTIKASKLTWQGSTMMRSLGKTQTHT
jgi:hypothetical protein